ncbi:MAG TPA: MBL fold metallo-hydrolase [Gemmatimonadaceae bacterium]|nr:MBL fold metallo-hydrolase [Gemmatimonadaceae bacterium]
MALRIRFWGTRGSVPTPGPGTVRYGGNTPCVEVRTSDDALAILDAGTGIRELGRTLLAAPGAHVSADVYVTHAHWDHIQGLPFFAPLFQPGHDVRIWAAPELAPRIERAVRAQMAPEVFPVPFDEVRAEVRFRAVADDGPAPHGLGVRTHPVRHPGGALGYRLADCNDERATLVYIPDNELDAAAPYPAAPDWRARLVAFIHGAALLVHDAMYTAEEAAAHRGWGHSAVEDAVALAVEAGVPRLVLFHHRPDRGDDEVDALLARARARVAELGARLEVLAASEGLCLTI